MGWEHDFWGLLSPISLTLEVSNFIPYIWILSLTLAIRLSDFIIVLSEGTIRMLEGRIRLGSFSRALLAFLEPYYKYKALELVGVIEYCSSLSKWVC